MTSDAPAVSPTLTPIIPEPLPPTATSAATAEELAFFDRVKKYIANKSTMNEFLKLCNLFSQDLIDRNVLVHKVSNFIGGNPDLMNWFKGFVNYEGSDEVIDNRPKAPTSRVALSNCRGLGPSYRLLPKRVSFNFSFIYLAFHFFINERKFVMNSSLYLLGALEALQRTRRDVPGCAQ